MFFLQISNINSQKNEPVALDNVCDNQTKPDETISSTRSSFNSETDDSTLNLQQQYNGSKQKKVSGKNSFLRFYGHYKKISTCFINYQLLYYYMFKSLRLKL